MIYIKKRVDSYQRVFALQKQREEVVGRLHIFLTIISDQKHKFLS